LRRRTIAYWKRSAATLLNTAEDPRLSRIFQNRIIQSWTPSSSPRMEDTLMALYGVLSARSAGARRTQAGLICSVRLAAANRRCGKIKKLCEQFPIYARRFAQRPRIAIAGKSLGLFEREKFGSRWRIVTASASRADSIASPWHSSA